MITIGRVFVGSLFVYSGWNKLIHPAEEFQYAIDQYQLFPSLIAKIISHTIPWVEFIFGAFLILGFLRKMSARILCLLSFGFIALLGSAMIRKINLENCGCFGVGIHLTPLQAFSLDSCLFLALLYLSFLKQQVFEIDGWIQKGKIG